MTIAIPDLEVVTLPNGQFAENCYLIADRRTREAVMIDPGEEPAMFLAELDTRAWSLRAIWLTHAHIDHILGVGAVRAATGAPIHLHPLDRPLYDALPQFGAWVGMQVPSPPAARRGAAPGNPGAGRRLRVRRAVHPGPLPRAA